MYANVLMLQYKYVIRPTLEVNNVPTAGSCLWNDQRTWTTERRNHA